jgi:GNAT superfamily N-acetyltransferase
MVIRGVKETDILFLKRLLIQLGYPDQNEIELQEKITKHQQEGYELLVAETDQEVVGFIALHWFHVLHLPGPTGRISAFCVDERFRSQGIGIQLLDAAERHFREKRCVKFEVMSHARRTASHQFYLKRGYVEDSKRFVKYA